MTQDRDAQRPVTEAGLEAALQQRLAQRARARTIASTSTIKGVRPTPSPDRLFQEPDR